MKLTEEKLKQMIAEIISESIYGSKYYKAPPRDPMLTLSPEDRKKIRQLTDSEDEEMQRTGYSLATTLQQDELVFPNDGDEPHEELPYEGDDYLDDLNMYKLNKGIDQMKKLGKIYGGSFASRHVGQVVGGVDKAYYLRKPALQRAADICATFDMSKVKPMIDAFTEGANEAAEEVNIPLRFVAKVLAGEIFLFGNDNQEQMDGWGGFLSDTPLKDYADLYT